MQIKKTEAFVSFLYFSFSKFGFKAQQQKNEIIFCFFWFLVWEEKQKTKNKPYMDSYIQVQSFNKNVLINFSVQLWYE